MLKKSKGNVEEIAGKLQSSRDLFFSQVGGGWPPKLL